MLQHSPLKIRLFSCEQSREIDRATISQFGIDGFTLMEIAAAGAAQIIFDEQNIQKTGLFLCGKGNNAGDALAVARYLADQHQHTTKIMFVLGDTGLSPDALRNYELLKKLSKNNRNIEWHHTPDDLPEALREVDYIVDGIFGTGLNSDIREPVSGIIHQINTFGKTVYSMDIPSGLNGTTGLPQGTCIKANCTLTFGTNKIGFYLNNAATYTGSVHVVPLPFPHSLLNSPAASLLNKELYNAIPPLTRHARHKYDRGVVHLLAGSEGLTGAAIIAAKSAVTHGAGAVFLYAPKKLLPVYEIALPEAIKIPLGDENDAFYKPFHQKKILETLHHRPGVLVAGPGTGTHPETIECLANILSEHTDGAIIDADALKVFSDTGLARAKHAQRWLLTPHPGEAKTYLGINPQKDHQNIQDILNLAKKQNTTILLKGNPSVIADYNGRLAITGYSTAMFTKAGFGDYLAGAVAAQYSIRKTLPEAVISVLYESFMEYQRLNEPLNFNPMQLIKG